MQTPNSALSRKRLPPKELAELKASLKMTKEQREVLVGLILGDGHLGTQDGGRTWRLVYSQGRERHGAYLEHVHRLFANWSLSPPVLIRGVAPSGEGGLEPGGWENGSLPDARPPGSYRRGDRLKFTTVSHGSLRFYGKAFYRDGLKVVPKGIGRLLTGRGLAYWYMDDGSMKSRQSKGLILNTHSFSLAEVTLLCGVLRDRFGLRATPRPQRSASGAVRHQIYISGRSYEAVRELILPYLLPEMMYKFPPPRKPRGRRAATTLASLCDAPSGGDVGAPH